MSRLSFEIFKDGAEIYDYTPEWCEGLEIFFTRQVEGYIRLGRVSKKITDGVCRFDRSALEDGEYSPLLILSDRLITLPKIRVSDGRVSPAPYGDTELRELSRRMYRLEAALDTLCKRTDGVEKRVYGVTIF